MARATIMLAMFLTGASTGALLAQGPSRMLPGWAVGGSIQQIGLSGVSTPTLTLRATKLPEQALGPDFAFSIFPEAFESGNLVFMTDLGLVGAARLPALSLLVRGGVSALAAVSAGSRGVLNLYLGGGAIVQISSSIGLRFDVERRFVVDDPRNGFFVVGVGITSIPRDRKSDG
ncbi:MAG: hypothetical protein HKM89_01735 [Gemmatimonadales bacterium]|nr:hypothetical protein [Gemmatimonadales bacterium]